MSAFLEQICALINAGDLCISEHGYDELADDGLTVEELLDGITGAVLVEEYPNYPKGHCILLLQKDSAGNLIHAIWGIPKNCDRPAVLVTAYRPDPDRWDADFIRRRK